MQDAAKQAQNAVIRYLNQGWNPIPLPPRSKNPNRKGWQDEEYTIEVVPRVWNNDQGVGLLTGEPSGGLVDVDLDRPEARAVARRLLPTTHESGREKSPRSHRWYYASPVPKTKDYKLSGTGDGQCFVELRANGRHTAVYPTIHPDDGDRYQWGEGEIAKVSGAQLAEQVADVAVAALLVSRWPGQGARHDYVNAAAGLLGRKLPRVRAEKIMVAAIEASGDEEGVDRHTTVRETLDRLERGDPVTGGPSLDELAPGTLAQLQRWGVLKYEGGRGEKKAKKGKDEDDAPTHDELRDRWLAAHPEYKHGLETWRRYDGGIWVEEHNNVVKRTMVETLEDAKDEGIRPSVFVVNSVHALAQFESYVPDERWDARREILVAENGAVDITTGELLDHSREHYATTRVPYDFVEDDEAPNWERFVASLDKDVTAFLQEYAGYCLTVDTSLEKAVWLVGPPGGGKSTYLEGLLAVLGARAGVLGLREIERNRFALAKLVGKSLVTAAEQPVGYLGCHDVINAIISGEAIQVERKYHDPYDYVPKAKIAWAMNELPRVPAGAEGLFRRIEVVKFPEIAAADRDPDLKEGIKREGAGILNWALEGLMRLRSRGGFAIPEKIAAATNQFREHSDIIGQFVEEVCDVDENLEVKSSELYSAYSEWCERTNHKPKTSTTIVQDWERLGFEKRVGKTGNFWVGVGLQEHRKFGGRHG